MATQNRRRLNLLLIEDNNDDAFLISDMLSEVRGELSFKVKWRDTLEAGLEEMVRGKKRKLAYDLVILDLHFPHSDGLDTLNAVLEKSPNVPIVVVTGLEDESIAQESIRRGAQDYLIKGKINDFILKRVIIHAIERFKVLREKERLINELKKAQENISVLSGLIPICSACKKIRDDTGYWQQVETYLRKHSEADFSHSICPECTRKIYPDLDE